MTKIVVQDNLQNYEYVTTEEVGQNFDAEFQPDLSPKQMLELGVFGGNYFEGYVDEYPPEWFKGAKISKKHDKSINYFDIDASQSRQEWQRKGWMYAEDPRGWFQWYCRYYMGRRIPDEDKRQIKRWKNIKRHTSQVQKYCQQGDINCRPRQRQALLHWAYDSVNM